jgi:hypothetical protein
MEDPEDVAGRIANGGNCLAFALWRDRRDDLAAGLRDLSRVASILSTITQTRRPGSPVGLRPSTQVPLTCPLVSSNARSLSVFSLVTQPKTVS